MLTPNGLEVSSLHFLISAFNSSLLSPPPAIIPNPPAFETAAANVASAILAIAPHIIGYFIPNNFSIFIFILL